MRTVPDAERNRWDARYRERGPEARDPAPFVRSLDAVLPRGDGGARRPAALDVAGGAGRHAIWLARRGLDVTLADFSPVALDLARQAAVAAGVALRTLEVDLETAPLPASAFDLILSVDFLYRPLFAAFPGALAPGGLLVVAHPTRSNLARHPHPSARFLLDDGELPRLARGLAVVRYEEGWFDDRHEARLVARKASALDPGPGLPPLPVVP